MGISNTDTWKYLEMEIDSWQMLGEAAPPLPEAAVSKKAWLICKFLS